MKTCTKCKETLNELAFSKDSRRKDGLQCWCKKCISLAIKKWSRTTRGKDSQRKRDKKYSKTEKGKAANRKASANYRDNHPERTKARLLVMSSLRNGTMTRQQCKVFDCFDIGEAHHEDYSKPLDVEWLCTKHHKQLHMEKNMSEDTGTATNRYCTVRTVNKGTAFEEFYVNIITFGGEEDEFGKHGYSHKRSARRSAEALAKRLDLSYRQDLEYSDSEDPHSFLATKDE